MGSFVGGEATGGSGSTTRSVTWPAVQNGDIAILAAAQNSSRTFTNPTGFGTPLGTLTDGSCKSTVWSRICDGTESGSLSLVQDGTGFFSMCLSVVRGFISVNGAPTSSVRASSSTSHDAPAVTPSVANAGIICALTERVATDSTTAATPPTGFASNKREFGASGSGPCYVGIATDSLSETRSSGVAVDPASWTSLVTSSDGVAWTIALEPVSSPAEPTHYRYNGSVWVPSEAVIL